MFDNLRNIETPFSDYGAINLNHADDFCPCFLKERRRIPADIAESLDDNALAL